MTAHQFALRNLGADGLGICDVDLGCENLGYEGISDVYGLDAKGNDAPARVMEMHDSKKATVRA
jgi:hypothetical protein